MKHKDLMQVAQAVAEKMHQNAQHRWVVERCLETYDSLKAIGEHHFAAQLAAQGKKIGENSLKGLSAC